MLREFRFECRDQRTILGIDRADATKQFVVVGDFQHALAWHVAPTQNIFKKRHDIVHALWTAK